MPEVGPSGYVATWWQEMGLAHPSGMGLTPFAAADVLSWARLSGLEVSPWEGRTLIRMSQAYVSQAKSSEAPECPPPYGKQVLEFDRSVIAKNIASALRTLKRKSI